MIVFKSVVADAINEYKRDGKFSRETYNDLVVILTFATNHTTLKESLSKASSATLARNRDMVTHHIFNMNSEAAMYHVYKVALELYPIVENKLNVKLSNIHDFIW